MNPGDIVRVIKQPLNLLVHIVDEVGFIESRTKFCESEGRAKQDDLIQIQTLQLDGSLGGSGWIPIQCVQLESSLEWTEAKNKYDIHINKVLTESKIYTAKIQAGRIEIATRYGITLEVLKNIIKDVRLLEDE